VDEYFGPLKKGPVEDESQSPEESTFESESDKCAGKFEVAHLAYIAFGDWQRFWMGQLGSSLKEPLMSAMFFQYFALHAHSAIAAKTYVLTCLPPLFTIYRG
jgi:hypothetical protein